MCHIGSPNSTQAKQGASVAAQRNKPHKERERVKGTGLARASVTLFYGLRCILGGGEGRVRPPACTHSGALLGNISPS